MSTCYYPLRVLWDAENNLVFSNDGIPSLPCGQCIGCRLNHAEGWAIRMVHEAQRHEENSFLTLTYNDEHLPSTKNLSYRALTLFIKRLRRQLSKTRYNQKWKYYAVGEYGENFSRPHYHIILFGFDFSYKLRYKGIENSKTLSFVKNEKPYFKSTFLNDLWGQGHCDIGEVNYNTCMYVAKYVTKKVNGRNKAEHYTRMNEYGELISVEPEKSQMSRKNAIGKEWLQQFWSDVYTQDSVFHQGKRLKVPKYYDKWLEKNNPDLFQQIKEERESSMSEISKSQIDLTREHEHKLLTQKGFSRDLDGTAPINQADENLLNYHKSINNDFHLLNKRKAQ